MLRSLLAAFATAQAASKAKHIAVQTGYGIVAIGALLIAFTFGAIALFFALSHPLGPAGAAAVVAGVSAGIAGAVALYARWKENQDEREDDMFDKLGLSSFGISSQQDVEAVARKARFQIRRIGPAKVAAAALAAGFLLGRR